MKLVAAPDAHICKFLPSGELVYFPAMLQIQPSRGRQKPLLIEQHGIHTTKVSRGFNPEATQIQMLSSAIGNLLAGLVMQVCFGSMQHEVLVFRYTGLSHCEPETPESLPFSRSDFLPPVHIQLTAPLLHSEMGSTVTWM